MWSNDHIGQVPERVVVRQGFWIRDIETRTAKMALLECIHQVITDYAAPAANVHEERACSHRGKSAGVEKLSRLVGKRERVHYDIRF